jgi:hypothetical protein
MDIILEVRNMIAEAESDHNDGYTKNYYKNRLKILKEILNEYASQKDIGEFKEEYYGMLDGG